jgi:hypothetical protein
MTNTSTSYLEALDALVDSRPMLEPGNYGDRASYRADQRGNVQARADYRLLRLYVAPTDAELADAARGSRIEFDGYYAHYCAGQYYPVEYRPAACRLLARVWWERTAKQEGRTADSLRAYARVLFGRGIARRWFS